MHANSLLLALLLPAHAICWAYEGSLHPFDSTTLRWQESTWESNTTAPPPILHRKHLLIVLITTTSRLPLVLASRRWRQGLTTVIVSDTLVNNTEYAAAFAGPDAAHEVWCTFPDTPHPWQKRGDLRAAMAPFLANVTMGVAGGARFKWMLFGDDDTVFHIPNTLRLLQNIHADVPHMLSDAMWFHAGQEFHHNRLAPRCLPCHYDDPLLEEEDSCPHLGFQAPRGCPCRQSLLCAWDNLGIFDPTTCEPGHPLLRDWWFAHGGAGVVMSHSLFAQGRLEDVEAYLQQTRQRNGDGMLHEAVLHVLKVAPSDPGPGYCRPYLQVFDPGWQGPSVAGRYGKLGIGEDPIGVLERYTQGTAGDPACARKCHEQLRSTISVHIRSQTSAPELFDLKGIDATVLSVQPWERAVNVTAVDPNVRAASWIAWQLAAAWEAYEAKLQQGGVPTAPVPTHRQSGHHDPALSMLLGSAAGWEALEALSEVPTATDLLGGAMTGDGPYLHHQEFFADGTPFTDDALLFTDDAQLFSAPRAQYEELAPKDTHPVVVDVDDDELGDSGPAVQHRGQMMAACMWTGLLLTALLVAMACAAGRSRGGRSLPTKSRPAKQTA